MRDVLCHFLMQRFEDDFVRPMRIYFCWTLLLYKHLATDRILYKIINRAARAKPMWKHFVKPLWDVQLTRFRFAARSKCSIRSPHGTRAHKFNTVHSLTFGSVAFLASWDSSRVAALERGKETWETFNTKAATIFNSLMRLPPCLSISVSFKAVASSPSIQFCLFLGNGVPYQMCELASEPSSFDWAD